MLLDFDGIQVEFPYEAYDCQIRFIRKITEALRKVTTNTLFSLYANDHVFHYLSNFG